MTPDLLAHLTGTAQPTAPKPPTVFDIETYLASLSKEQADLVRTTLMVNAPAPEPELPAPAPEPVAVVEEKPKRTRKPKDVEIVDTDMPIVAAPRELSVDLKRDIIVECIRAGKAVVDARDFLALAKEVGA